MRYADYVTKRYQKDGLLANEGKRCFMVSKAMNWFACNWFTRGVIETGFDSGLNV